MNVIDRWHEHMQLLKWKRAMPNDPYLRNLDAIKQELALFFDFKDFAMDIQPEPDNWLYHVFFNLQDASLYVINETAELLRYYRSLSNQADYHLKNNEGRVNYKRLQEGLYELYVRYIFNSAGFKYKIGQFYTSESGNNKEIDLLLDAGGRTYNVEITKFYDTFKEGIVALSQEVLEEIGKTVLKKLLTQDELFSGYFAFKYRRPSLIKKRKQLIGHQIQKFIDGYRKAENNTLLIPKKIENDEFEFEIEPMFSGNFDKKYNQYLAKFPGSIKFRVSGDIQTNMAHIEANAFCRETVAEQNVRVQNKIKEKIKQHADSPHPLLIIIAVEQIFSTHPKNRTIAIRQSEIDKHAVHRVIKGKAAVMFVFKDINEQGYYSSSFIIGDEILHNSLLPALGTLNLQVRYLPVS
ncbi:hypothetical protein KXD93_17140 [Mucilaginibacter sp. BJC16-A38]|uniref:hypothetical protein n=1 Tax=Mucilaginibacter phenanthrenivorans TaxID=1234842 RepID=UPI002158465B|nr:hypothetical protein [Mucilaginibacter phenanthrenivorans]MCR8559385.1 hypothetical protein [Mucilaginibacter phenanthrenivorans]